MIKLAKLLIFLYSQHLSAGVLDGVTIQYDPLWLLSSGFSSSVEKSLGKNVSIETQFSFAPMVSDIDGEEVSFFHKRYGVRVNLYSESTDDESFYTTAGIGMRGVNPTNENDVSDYDGVNIPYYEFLAGTQWRYSETTMVKTGVGFVMGGVKDIKYNLSGNPLVVNSAEITMMDSGLEPHLSVSHTF